MAALQKKNLYAPEHLESCRARIEALTSETRPGWGRMTSAQMLAHCAGVLEVSNGESLENTPLAARLLKGLIRKMVVGGKPYPRNSRTHPQYLQTSPADFDREKQRLLAALDRFRKDEGKPIPHPLFGIMSREEKGWAMYKHLDHHLTQFGV